MFYKLKCRFSEPYRIRHGFGLSPIRTTRELHALIIFCREELIDVEHMKLNPERKAVYKTTIELFENDSPKLHYYINDHVGWYWN